MAVDLLVDGPDREPCAALEQLTGSLRGALHHGFFWTQLPAQLRTAARARCDLLWRARISWRPVERILKRQRSGGSSDPQSYPEASFASTAEQLACTDHGGRALELLDREETQRVAHQNRDARAIIVSRSPKA